jgi:NodT family efflux transporter outer membrane factor (OMF) lipoprotein
VEEEGATWQATKAEYEGTIISVTTELANSYINLRTYQEELEVARHLLESETNVMDIAEARHECALASGLDVAQAKAVYYSTKASIPSLEASIATSINSIALLSGVDKDELEDMLSGVPRIPQYSGLIITEIPESLLLRRPDVIAAAYQVDSYAAAVGVAKSAYLPSLTLDASVGTASHRIKNIFSHDALTYSIAPTLSWTLFTGFSRKYATAQAEEQLRIGMDNYDLTLLTAEEEANNALVQYHYSITRIGLLNSVLAESIKAFNFALDQYKQGLSAFINVVDAQINLLNYNNQLIEERSNAQLYLVSLYQALGGGW